MAKPTNGMAAAQPDRPLVRSKRNSLDLRLLLWLVGVVVVASMLAVALVVAVLRGR